MSQSNPLAANNVGSELLRAVTNALSTLAELERHRHRMGDQPVNLAMEVVADARRRIERQELFVCVVGEKKAGKSTFLNAILGQPLLSTAVRECTGTVTFLRSGNDIAFKALLENGKTETFETAFRDRTVQVCRICDRSSNQVEACTHQAKELPVELEKLRADRVASEGLLASLSQQSVDSGKTYEELCLELGSKQTALTAFENELKTNSKNVPYAYRQETTWYDPVRWVGQKMLDKKAKPEWKEHLDQVKKCTQSKVELESFRKVVEKALEHCEMLRRRIAETGQRLIDLGKAIVITERRLRELPARTVTRTHRYERLKSYKIDYVEVRKKAFVEAIGQLTDQNKRGAEVSRLEIWVPSVRLPRGLVIIDTPGVNTDNQVNRNRAWETIRRDADGCMVVSDIQQTVSQSTRDFVREVKGYLPHLILVMTKLDRALESAEIDDLADAQQQIEEAKRIGEERFAVAVGRPTDDILSFAVSALPALRNEPKAAERFGQDTAVMAEILKNERALIVATRCATTIGTVSQQIASAQRVAEQGYAKEIADLEANRIPDPVAFCRQQMRTVQDKIESLSDEIASAGVDLVDAHYEQLGVAIIEQLGSCSSGSELKSCVEGIRNGLERQLGKVNRGIQTALAQPTAEAIRQLEEPLLNAIREKYRIVQSMSGTAGRQVAKSDLGLKGKLPAIEINLSGIVSDYQSSQIGGVAGGAVAGAAIGSVVPVVGTILGGVLGGMAGMLFGPSFDATRSECIQKFAASMIEVKRHAMEVYANSGPAIRNELTRSLDRALQKTTSQYGKWIDGIIREERQRIENERSNLNHLVQLKERMVGHLHDLTRLTELARQQSRGLAR